MRNNEFTKARIIMLMISFMASLEDEERRNFSSEVIYNASLYGTHTPEEALDLLKCSVMDCEVINNEVKHKEEPVAA